MQREKAISPLIRSQNLIQNSIFSHTPQSQPEAATSNTGAASPNPTPRRTLLHRHFSQLMSSPLSNLLHTQLARTNRAQPAPSPLLPTLGLTLLLTADLHSGCAGCPGGLGKGALQRSPSTDGEPARQDGVPKLEVGHD